MRSQSTRFRRIDPIAFGAALSTMIAATVATLEFTSKVGWGERWRALFADIYPGYDAEGDVGIGIAWGTIDGFLAGSILAWLYNRFRRA